MIKNLMKSIKKTQKGDLGCNQIHCSSDNLNDNDGFKPGRGNKKHKIKLQYAKGGNPSINIEELTISIVNTSNDTKERGTPLLRWSASLDNLVKGCSEDSDNEFNSIKRNYKNSFDGENNEIKGQKVLSKSDSGTNMADEEKVELGINTPSNMNCTMKCNMNSPVVYSECFHENKNAKDESVSTSEEQNCGTIRKALFNNQSQTPIPLPRRSKYNTGSQSCMAVRTRPHVVRSISKLVAVTPTNKICNEHISVSGQTGDYMINKIESKNLLEQNGKELSRNGDGNERDKNSSLRSIKEESILDFRTLNENSSMIDSPHFVLSTSNLNDSSCTYVSYFNETFARKMSLDTQSCNLDLERMDVNNMHSIGLDTRNNVSISESMLKDYINCTDQANLICNVNGINNGENDVCNLKKELEKKLHIIDNLKNINEELEEKLLHLRNKSKNMPKTNLFKLLTADKDNYDQNNWRLCPLSLYKDEDLQFMIEADQQNFPFIKRINSNKYLMKGDRILEINGIQTMQMNEMDLMKLYNSLPNEVLLDVVVLRKEVTDYDDDDSHEQCIMSLDKGDVTILQDNVDDLQGQSSDTVDGTKVKKMEQMEIFCLLDHLCSKMLNIKENESTDVDSQVTNIHGEECKHGKSNEMKRIINKLKNLINNS